MSNVRDKFEEISLDEEAQDENTSLLASAEVADYATFDEPAKPSSYWDWLPNFSSVRTALTAWLPSPQVLLNSFFSTFTAIPYLPYTMQLYTGTHPDDFSVDWWLDLPVETQILASSMSVFTFAISVLVHYCYFPDTGKRLVEVLTDWTDKKMVNSITIYLTVATMISAYGLGYDGMNQSGTVLAVLTGLINAGLYGAFRLTFVPSFIDRLKKGEFNKLWREGLTTQTAGYLFDLLAGSALFVCYGLFNIQTGYRGMEIIGKLCGYSTAAFKSWQKILLGASSGLSSGMFAFVMGHDMRNLFLSVYRYLADHHERLTINLLLLSGITISSALDIGPIASPAFNIANDPGNLIFISIDNVSGPLFIACASLFSFLLDFSAMKALAFPQREIEPISNVTLLPERRNTELAIFSLFKKKSSEPTMTPALTDIAAYRAH